MLNNETSKGPVSAVKAKQINIRLTGGQERLMRQHCVRQDVTTQQAVIEAIALLIDGFKDA